MRYKACNSRVSFFLKKRIKVRVPRIINVENNEYFIVFHSSGTRVAQMEELSVVLNAMKAKVEINISPEGEIFFFFKKKRERKGREGFISFLF